MSFKDLFDQMMIDIEKLVEYDVNEGYLKADKIGEIIARQFGIPGRDLNVIFNYISGGKTLNRYIKSRKMMATYKMMIEDKKYDVQSYLDCSGFEVESSFSRVFSEKFGVPPTMAHKQKDETKIESPLTIEGIINDSDLPENNDSKSEKVFGIPKEYVDRYNEIRDYQALFGIEGKYAELAVYLNDEKGINLHDAFSSVENLIMDYEDVASINTLESLLYYVDTEVPALYIKHLYKNVCLPELNTWYFHMKDDGGDLLKETPEFVYAYFDSDSAEFTYTELKSLYNDYLKRSEESDAKHKDSIEKRIDDTKEHTNKPENSLHTKKSEDGFKEYLIKIQMCGSIEAYEDFMEELIRDYK